MRGRIEILGAMFLFGLMPAFTRAAGTDFLSVALYRALMVAGLFSLDAARRGVLPSFRDREFWRVALPYGLCLGVASASFVGGYALTTVASTVFLHHLAPLIVFPVAHRYLGERAGPEHIAGAILAVLGVGAMSGAALWAHHDFASARFLLGDLLALLSAIGYAGVLMMTRVSRTKGTDIGATLAGAWWIALLTIAVAAVPAGAVSLPAHAIPATTGLAIFATVAPFVLLNRGMRGVSASEASVLSFSEVVFAALVGLVVFGEGISGAGWIGGLLVLAGVYLPLAPVKGGDGGSDAGAADEIDLAKYALPGVVLLLALNSFVLFHLFAGSELALAGAWVVLAALVGILLELGPAANLPAGWLRGGRLVVGALLAVGLARSFPWSVHAAGGADLAVAVGLLALALLAGRAPRRRSGEVERLAAAAVAVGGLFAAGSAETASAIFMAVGGLALAGVAVGHGCLGVGAKDPVSRGLGRLATGKAIAALVLVAWLAGALVVVGPGEIGVIDRFGRALRDRLLDPGVHLVWPTPVDRVTRVDTGRVRRLELPGPRRVLSGDQSFLDVGASILYRIDDPISYLFDVESAETCLERSGRKALLTVGARSIAEDLLGGGRALAEAELASTLRAEAGDYGLEVIGALLTAVEPPKEIRAAFHDVIDADEERATAVNRARADETRLLPDVRGRARGARELGKAAGHEAVAKAKGEAGRFGLLAEIDSAHPRTFRVRTYLEEIEAALDSVGLVLTTESGALWLTHPSSGMETRASKLEQGRE